MNPRDDFNGIVSGWLDDQAGRGAPDYLNAILARTIKSRQRPSWSSLERWLPVQLTFSARLAPITRLAWTFVIVAILVLAAAVLLLAGVGQRRLPHFGAAANGSIAFVDGSNLRATAADGSNPRTLTSLPDGAELLTFSPDGMRLAYRTTGSVRSIVVANADGSGPVAVVSSAALATGEPFSWSPDSRRLTFTMVLVADKIGTIDVVDADGLHLRQVIVGSAAKAVDRFAPKWSPDGQWISFLSTEANGYVAVNVIHPDGSAARKLETSPISADLGPMAWSPDPGGQRLIYVAGAYVKIYDVATAKETTVDAGFWPTWSPDGREVTWWNEGTHLDSVADLLVGLPKPRMVFPMVPGATCQDNPKLAAKAICAPAQWSPDGAWIYGPDVVGKAIVFGRADGSSLPHAITLDHPVDLSKGPSGMAAWQPVAP